MKKKLLAQGIFWGAALMTTYPVIAGLSLSDSPMFVTEALSPNVLITPVLFKGYNETILKDLPWGIPAQSAILLSDTWKISRLTANPYGFRVTPWPNTVFSKPSAPNGCVVANNFLNGYVCSQTSLYSISGGADILVTGATEVDNNPLGYLIVNNNYSTKGGYYNQELYPQRANYNLVDARYSDAKSRYFHSNSNFLYFDADAADAYEAWPNLGGLYSFASYGDVASARDAKYSPMVDAAGTVALDAFVDNWMPDSIGFPVKHQAYVGQYWKKTAGSDVTLPESFVGTCWEVNAETSEFGCTNTMTETQKKQFAHWFTYWRSSDLATRGMFGKLFKRLADADLLDKFRFSIGKRSGTFTDGFYSVANAVGANKSEKTANLLASIGNVIYSPDTNFVQSWQPSSSNLKLASDDAYRDAAGQPLRSCRRNYEVLVTPDYSQLSWAMKTYWEDQGLTNKHADKLAGVPFPDNYMSTWSDVGAEGWATDLRSEATGNDLPNNILPSLRDPATHQHVVRYIIGPNAEGGDIFPSGSLTYGVAWDRATAATANNLWPNPDLGTRVDFRPTFDDLWHMALNSRGFFYPSNNVSEATAKLLETFNDVLVRNVSGSAVATNTSSLESGGKIYLATVESDWKGHLRAYNITLNAAETILEVDYDTPLWDLAEKVSALDWSARKIATYDGSDGVPFRWGSISATEQNRLKAAAPEGVKSDDNRGSYAQRLLEYLRGSGACEDGHSAATNALCTSGVAYTFRRRNIDRSKTGAYTASNPNGRNVLGDISNSNPWLISPPPTGRSDVDYPGYNTHRVDYKGRPNILYVGANDGMLHAVNSSDGAELFAYVPSFVQANLHTLANIDYSHKFFVDGSPFAAEVDLGEEGWKTVLAGGANKGGKGYYLLDVTDPTANTELNAANWVKWEFTHPSDLHYTYNLPVADGHGQARQIARMNDGNLALIVGNGYPEAAGKKACLFILPLSGPGAVPEGDAEGVDYHGGYHKLCAGEEAYADGGLDTNGLSTPTPIDLNGDGKVDVIYAGDLNGNMWKFDVSNANPTTTTGEGEEAVVTNNWAVAYALFVAKNADEVRQPIITPPELTFKAEGERSGPLVLFGTGKYIESSDRPNLDRQSFYGVWDRGLSDITRDNLFEQTFLLDETITPNRRHQVSKLSPSYCTAEALGDCFNDTVTIPAPATNRHLGWFWDMPTDGERLTGKMNLINGIVLFNTFYPATEEYDCDGIEGGDICTRLDPCQYGGDGWLMGLNAVNGYMEDKFAVFDVNQDGVIDAYDASHKAAGVKLGAAIGGTSFARGIKDTKVGLYAPTNKVSPPPAVIDTGTAGSGRVSWFELLD